MYLLQEAAKGMMENMKEELDTPEDTMEKIEGDS